MAVDFAYAAAVLKPGLGWPLVLAYSLINFVRFPPGWDVLLVVDLAVIFAAHGVCGQRLTRPALVRPT